MRLTIESRGYTFILAWERDKESVSNLTPSDLSSDTERAPQHDYDNRSPIGFATNREARP